MPPALPPEIGPRLRTERAVHPVLAAVVVAGPGLAVLVAVGLALGPGEAVVAVVPAVALWVVALLVLGEVLGFRHHVHQHAIVTTSSWPYRTRVVPFSSIDPDSVRAAGYQRADGTWKDSRDRRFRQVPFVATMRLVGLGPDRATELARGRVTWAEAPYVRRSAAGFDLGEQAVPPVEWVLAWRSPEDDVAWLRGLVAASADDGPG